MIAVKVRYERVCRWFVELAAAAGVAGYSPKGANVAGYRLLGRPRVARRIAEIGAETARLHGQGGEMRVGKLENVYRRAIVDHPFHAGGRRRQRRLAPFVNFCNGGKSIYFNEISETGVYFCI